MDVLREVLDAPARERPAGRARRSTGRRLRLAAAPALLVGAILLAGLATDAPVTSAAPDDAQAARAWEDPCGILPRPQVGALVPGTLGSSDDRADGAVAACLHQGVPGSAVLFADVQVVTAASLAADTTTGPLAGAGSLEAALDRLRGAAAPDPAELAGLGDEAVVLDTGVQTVWVRQGAVLLGVAVAVADGPDDVGAAEGIARLLLGAIATS